MKKSLHMGRSEWLLLFLLATLWGSSFLFMKIAVGQLPVFTVVLGRIGIAALLLTAVVYGQGHRLPSTLTQWGQFILLGILRAGLPITLFVWAGSQIDSSISGILNSTTPLFTAIIAHFLTKDERFNMRRLVGVLISMVGVVFLIGPSALQGLGQNVLAQLAVLGATCSYGFAGVYGRRFGDTPIVVTTASFLIGATLLIIPFTLLIDKPWTLQPTFTAVAAVFTLATFNTAIAFMVWLALNLRAGANNTAQVTFLIPIMAIVLGVIILDEQLHWNS
ncbi:MAG TPA: DMT family transporter, partial [Anaerolineae bacterium]|nr:DMT family transporter [Anaerolineae bacterium]